MASSPQPVSTEVTATTSPKGSLEQTTFFNLEEYLENKNYEFVSSLAPTLTYLSFVMLCGLAGNCMVFVVYYRRFKPSVTRTYIVAMSVCDLLTNLLSLPADMVEVRFHNTFQQPWLCKSFRTVKSVLSFQSAFILVAVAFDRQRAICSPRTSPATVKRTLVVIGIVSVTALLFTVPYTVVTGGNTVTYPDSNLTGVECSIDDVYIQSLFLFIYNVVTGLVLIVCISLMLGSYIRIARQLWLHKKNTAILMGTSAQGKDPRKASAMSSNTYTFEESSSGMTHSTSDNSHSSSHNTHNGSERTHGCSKKSQPSLKAGNDQASTDTKLAQMSSYSPISEEPPGGSCAETALVEAEKANQDVCLHTDTRLNDDGSHPTAHTDRAPGDGEVSGSDPPTNTTHSGQTAQHSEARTHNYQGRKLSEPKHGHTASRSAMSRIHRAASDAKSFVTRKKSSTPTIRGCVKKIPTRTTFMMFVLTIIFIVNYLPYLVVVSVRSRLGNDHMVTSMGLNSYHVSLRSYFLNSAVNPLVYSFCSARFRQECRRLFHCSKR
ncbi:hypothetical protein ACOMHN_004779 [Nucella lapillus]